MGVKPAIFVLLFVQNCLCYPIDGQDTTNGVEFTPLFSNDLSTGNTNAQMIGDLKPEAVPISSHYESRQYIPGMEPNPMQFGPNYLNNAEPYKPTHFGGHRPIGRPPRPQPYPPMDIPDDVEVFAPPPGPISPPRPIPVGPPHSPPDVETFWPINGKPVPFPKGEVFSPGGNMEMLPNQPLLIERGRFPVIPENIEGDIRMVPEPMRNEGPMMMEREGLSMRPVIVEKQGSVILDREQPPQMMPVYLENGPARMTPTIIEKIERPVIIEEQHPRMPLFREIEQAPMIMEKEMSFMSPMEQPQMTFKNPTQQPEMPPFGEIEQAPMIVEKGMPFMSPMGPPQMTFKNPTEFRPIPQVLPERFKRQNQAVNDSETTNLPQETDSDQPEGRSIVDNEISSDDSIQNNFISIEEKHAHYFSTEKLSTSNEVAANSEISVHHETSSMIGTSPTTSSTIINTNRPDSDPKIEIENEKPATVQNIPTNEQSEISTTISTQDSKKILNYDDSSLGGKILVDGNSKHEEPSNLDITVTLKPSNNIDEKISTTISTQDPKKILNDDDSSLGGKLLVDEDSKHEEPSNLDITITSQPSDNKIDEKVSTTISTLDSKKILNDDDSSLDDKILVDEDSKNEESLNLDTTITLQPSNNKVNEKVSGQLTNSDISTLVKTLINNNDENMIELTSMSTSGTKIEDVNRNLATEQPLGLNSDISATEQPPKNENNEKIIKPTSMHTLDAETEDLSRKLATKKSLISVTSTTTQPLNNKNNEKRIPSTSTSTLSMEIKDMNGNMVPRQPANLGISTTAKLSNKKIEEVKIAPSPMTTTSIADGKIETGGVNTNLVAHEGIQSTKLAEISTILPIIPNEKIHSKITDGLVTELKRLLEDIETMQKKQNLTLDEHRGLPDTNQPSIHPDAIQKTLPILYTHMGEIPNPVYIPNGNLGGPVVFPHPPIHSVYSPSLQYDLYNELDQLLGNILSMQHELQTFPVSYEKHSLSPIVYPSYNHISHYPFLPFSPLSIERTSQNHSHNHN